MLITPPEQSNKMQVMSLTCNAVGHSFTVAVQHFLFITLVIMYNILVYL